MSASQRTSEETYENATTKERLTGYNVSSVKWVFVLNESKSGHKLDLVDLAGASAVEMVFYLLLRSWVTR